MIDGATKDLEDELATLAARVTAAMARFFVLLAELEERGEWAGQGYTSIVHWVRWRCGLDKRTARAYVRVARALKVLPRTREAMERGELSYSKVRAITRVAKAENEEKLLYFARNSDAEQLESIAAKWKRAEPEEERDEADRHELRRFAHAFFDDDGMLVIRARLAPDEGAIFMRAMESAREELWKDKARKDLGAAQQRADQLALVADRSLSEKAAARSGSDRVTVFVHVDAQAADGPAEPDRRLACDAATVKVEHGAEGELKAGRWTRVVSSALRRALRVRDGGVCTFPGCTHRVVDAHHIHHWVDGGPTVLRNMISLCRSHHTLVHEGGFKVDLGRAGPRFFRPDGRVVPVVPPVKTGPPLAGPAGPWSLAPEVTTLRIDWDAMGDHLPA